MLTPCLDHSLELNVGHESGGAVGLSGGGPCPMGAVRRGPSVGLRVSGAGTRCFRWGCVCVVLRNFLVSQSSSGP